MNGSNRTDRTIILIALAILLLAGGFFYFDSWMWGGHRDRSEKIGIITSRTGDIRHKLDGDLKWQRASSGDDLVYNDAVYAGSGSQAELQVGQSKMTVSENTLVVLRRQKELTFLNLNYGTLFSKVAKNEKIVVEDGSGKTFEISSAKNSNLVFRKTKGGKTQVDVTSGEAEVMVNGQKKLLHSSEQMVLDDKAHVKTPDLRLHFTHPVNNEIVYSEGPVELPFGWAWSGLHRDQLDDQYTLEFSTTPTFEKLHASKGVRGHLETTMHASQSLSLYTRVRGPDGELSEVERVTFVRMAAPTIVKPIADFHYVIPQDQPNLTEAEIQHDSRSNVWYQIARDAEFKNLVVNRTMSETKAVNELPDGQYFIRARASYPGNNVTAWTQSNPFTVEKDRAEIRLSGHEPPTHIIIPNRSYPPDLYGASPKRVREYMASRGFLNDFFPLSRDQFDEIRVQHDGGDPIVQKDASWAKEYSVPGRYLYRYQVSKMGYKPSAWSSERRLQIEMEPPHPVGRPSYGELDADGHRPTSFAFTPLLYAASYDVELSHNTAFTNATELKTTSATVHTKLKPDGDYYWRARARDRQGRIISQFSKPNRLENMPQVPQFLARNDANRKPASDEGQNRVQVNRNAKETWEPSGWWAWVGSGMNFTEYRQSVPGVSTLDSQDNKSPSEYLEGGYIGAQGWGGIVSYKRTPGQIAMNNAAIDHSDFLWTTMGLEATWRKAAPFTIFGRPVLYGMRAGMQDHHLPFIFVKNSADPLQLKNNEMLNASAGVLLEQTRDRWKYYWLMRYQYPISSSADGSATYSINPTFAFDGSLGTSYNFTDRAKIGLFWYGQWHQFNFVYGDGADTNRGFQSLFYSNIDLRLGFDF